MDIFGILDPDPDPHENLSGSETLQCNLGARSYLALGEYRRIYKLKFVIPSQNAHLTVYKKVIDCVAAVVWTFGVHKPGYIVPIPVPKDWEKLVCTGKQLNVQNLFLKIVSKHWSMPYYFQNLSTFS